MRHAFAAFASCAVSIAFTAPGAADQLMVSGHARTYAISQPATAKGPQPTIIVLHDAKSSGAAVAQPTKLDVLAPQQGFVAVFPDGQQRGWNFFLPGEEAEFFVKASGGHKNVPDDGTFLKALIDDLVKRGVADANRIYLVGESDGGLMALRMICTDSNLFAGVALLGSAMPETVGSDCHPSHPMPALMIKGTKDEALPYGGGLFEPSETFRVWSTDRLVGFFRQLSNDRGPPQSSILPRKVPNVVQIDQWTDCAGIPLAVYRVIDGTHIPPPDLNEGQVALDFFASPSLQRPCVASLQNPAAGAGGQNAPANSNSAGPSPNGQGANPNGTPGDTSSSPNSPTNGTGPSATDPNAPNGPNGNPAGTGPSDTNTAGLGPPPDNNNPGDTAGLGPPPDNNNPGDTAGLGPPPDNNNPGDTAGLGPPTDSSPTSPGPSPGPTAMVPPPYTPLPPIFIPIPGPGPGPGPVATPPMCPPCNPGCMTSQPKPGSPPATTNTGTSPGSTTAMVPPTGSTPNNGSIYGGTCNTVGSVTTCTGSDGRSCTTTSGFCDPGASRAKPTVPKPGSGKMASPAPLPPATIKLEKPLPPPSLPTSTASTGAGNLCAPKLPATNAVTTQAPPSLPGGTASTTAAPRPPPPKKRNTTVTARRTAPRNNAYNAAAEAAAAAAAASAVMGIVGAFGHRGGGGGGGNICHR